MTDYVEDIELDAKLMVEAYRLIGDPDRGQKFRAFAAALGLGREENKKRAMALLLEFNPEYCRAVKERARELQQDLEKA